MVACRRGGLGRVLSATLAQPRDDQQIRVGVNHFHRSDEVALLEPHRRYTGRVAPHGAHGAKEAERLPAGDNDDFLLVDRAAPSRVDSSSRLIAINPLGRGGELFSTHSIFPCASPLCVIRAEVAHGRAAVTFLRPPCASTFASDEPRSVRSLRGLMAFSNTLAFIGEEENRARRKQRRSPLPSSLADDALCCRACPVPCRDALDVAVRGDQISAAGALCLRCGLPRWRRSDARAAVVIPASPSTSSLISLRIFLGCASRSSK